jgi:hypothetical protein
MTAVVSVRVVFKRSGLEAARVAGKPHSGEFGFDELAGAFLFALSDGRRAVIATISYADRAMTIRETVSRLRYLRFSNGNAAAPAKRLYPKYRQHRKLAVSVAASRKAARSRAAVAAAFRLKQEPI